MALEVQRQGRLCVSCLKGGRVSRVVEDAETGEVTCKACGEVLS